MKIWTPERIARAVEVLRATPKDRLENARATLSQEFGFNVTEDALRFGVYRYGGTTVPRELGLDVEAARLAAEGVDATQPMPAMTFEEAERVLAEEPIEPAAGATSTPAERPSETRAELDAHRLRRENAELASARKRLLAEIADREEQIAILKELRARDPLPPIIERPTVGAMQRQGIPVLVCSDWHIEEPVEPAKVMGLNEYSLDIADRCIDRLVDAFEWLTRDARYDCREAIIALLGDLLSGYIHAELEEANSLSPVEAILWLSERIERMLRRIAARCPEIARFIVVCCDGNHGRNTHKIRVATRSANSLEWLLYHTLSAKMADDPRFDFRIAEGEWVIVDVYDQRIAFTHGDSFQYGGGVGGMSIPIRRGIARQFQGQQIAKFCMGHFHQRQDFGDILVNGSMIGPTPYSVRIHAPYEPRMQSWFLWDSRRGQALSAPVWL